MWVFFFPSLIQYKRYYSFFFYILASQLPTSYYSPLHSCHDDFPLSLTHSLYSTHNKMHSIQENVAVFFLLCLQFSTLLEIAGNAFRWNGASPVIISVISFIFIIILVASNKCIYLCFNLPQKKIKIQNKNKWKEKRSHNRCSMYTQLTEWNKGRKKNREL